MSKTKLAKKITLKEITGGTREIRKAISDIEDGQELPAGVIFGRVSGAKKGVNVLPDGSSSEYVRLLGTFRAIPSFGQDAGKTFIAAQCIMPDVANAPIVSALESMGAVDEGEEGGEDADEEGAQASAVEGASLEFAMQIGVKRVDSAATGYQFTAEPLTETKEDPGIAALAALVADKAPALAAPGESESQEEAEPEKKAASGSRRRSK